MGMTWKGSEFVTQRGRDSRLLGAEGGDRSHEKTMRVADGTADTETGQLLIIKLCLCHIFLLNYKCLNISHFHNSTVFYTIVCYQSQSIHTQPTITVDTTPHTLLPSVITNVSMSEFFPIVVYFSLFCHEQNYIPSS